MHRRKISKLILNNGVIGKIYVTTEREEILMNDEILSIDQMINEGGYVNTDPEDLNWFFNIKMGKGRDINVYLFRDDIKLFYGGLSVYFYFSRCHIRFINIIAGADCYSFAGCIAARI